MTRPLGFIVSGKAAAVEPLLTSSGLRDRPSSLLCPRLTPAFVRGPLLASAPAVADGLGLQVSLSKNVNSCCTTGPFISGAEHWAALCRASSPAPSTLYGLSVRRLISFDRWLPSHETSRSRSCFGLVLGPSSDHEGQSDSGVPAQGTCTPSVHAHVRRTPAAPNPAIASRLHAGRLWRGVGEPDRSAASDAGGLNRSQRR